MTGVREETLLVVEGLHKRFARTIPARRKQLMRQFSRAVRGKPDDVNELAADEFWSLEDVSFSLCRGEALGLIGLNGAGKSTLLSVIARQLLPDRGEVRSRGEIAAMINLTAGFENSLTGRENVFLKGALLGRSRNQMQDRFDEIVEFSEIGDFLDSPVGTYSSGMRMRLAFSVAVHTEPDLLLIDEVLSVGDFTFRQKCLGKLNELRSSSSFVFVSHSFGDIARFCTRLLVLDGGRLIFDGPVQEGILVYRECGSSSRPDVSARTDGSIAETSGDAPLALMGDFVHLKKVIDSVSFRWCKEDGSSVSGVPQGSPVLAEIQFRLLSNVEGIAIGIPFWNDESMLVTSLNSDVSGMQLEADADGWVALRVRMDSVDFNPGTYFPVLSIMKNYEFVFRKPVSRLEVGASYGVTWGVFTPSVEWFNVEPRSSDKGCTE